MVIEVKHRTSVCKMTRWFVGGAFLCSGCPSLETPADRAPVLVAAPPGPCTRLAAQTLGVPRAVSVIGVFSGVHLCFCSLSLAISAARIGTAGPFIARSADICCIITMYEYILHARTYNQYSGAPFCSDRGVCAIGRTAPP